MKRNRLTYLALAVTWALTMIALAPRSESRECIEHGCSFLGIPICCEWAPDPPPPTNPRPKKPFAPNPGEPEPR